MFPSERPPLPAGHAIGKYVVSRHLGQGGNGAVYEAVDSVLGRRVALKLLHPQLVFDPQIAGRFRQEAQAMAQLNHPNVVTVYDFVGEAGTWAIVMELIEAGETLASLLRREGRLAPARAVRLIEQVAAGLGHAHGRGVVHRDVKPANVMIVRQSGGEVAKISDFGIARLVHGEKRTQGQLTLGTLWYLAPEQAQSSSVDARADVYALGATLYEALTGRVVFPYDNVARVLAAALAEAPVPPSQRVPGIPPALDALVLRFIAKSPDARPAHGDEARALLAELARELEGAPAASTPSSLTPRAMTPSVPAPFHTPSHAIAAQAPIPVRSFTPGPIASPAPQGIPSAPPSHAPPFGQTPGHGFGQASGPAFGQTPAAPLVPVAAALAPAPAVIPGSASAASQQTGLWIGVGVVALISLVCVLSGFLCVVTGFLRS